MKIVFLILPLFFSTVRCATVCDLLGLDCVTETAITLSALIPIGGWQNIGLDYVIMSAVSLVHCTTLCSMGHFIGLVYFPVRESCYLIGKEYLPTFNLVSNGIYKNPDLTLLTNVALGKQTYSTTPWAGSYPSSNVVDGNHNSFYTSQAGTMNWWLVDLGMAYDIFDIKLVHRQDGLAFSRFSGVEVRAGNTMMTGPDFSSFDFLGIVDPLPSSFKEWFVIITSENSPPYQFISLQLTRPSGGHLDI